MSESEPTWIPLSDPDLSEAEVEAIREVLHSPRLSRGPTVERFEAAFASYVGRKHAVATASGSLGLLLALEGLGIGKKQEVIAPSYSWSQAAHAIDCAGAVPAFVDVDYWSGNLIAEKVEAKIGPRTAAILASNSNGHPAPWGALRELAERHGLALLEDSCEAIGSRLGERRVGSFGDCAVFDFAQPFPLCCGEGGMIVTDDAGLAASLRRLAAGRGSGIGPAVRAEMSDVSAALGLTQLSRIDEILERRKCVERAYFELIKSFEGIKDPYVAPEVEEVHWLVYLVHLGTRFSRSSRDAIVEDMRSEGVEVAPFSEPLHLQSYYRELGYGPGDLFVTEKLADRALALPFHAHLGAEQIAFIVTTLKDASVNVGAGSAIYL